MYEVESSFTFNSLREQKIISPFDGEIQEVFVENGDQIQQGQKLLALDTTEQDLSKINLSAKRVESLKKMSVAMNEGKTAEVQIAKSEIKQIEAA